jgi:hypothetical protein
VNVARADFLSNQRKQITKRLEDLRPLYEEYLTLEKAEQALGQLGAPVRRAAGGVRGGSATGRGPGRPRTQRNSGRPRARRSQTRPAGRARTGRTTARRTKRSRAGGTRSDQALATIRATPGITIPDLARKLGIQPNYLYRVTAALEKQRRIKRRGRGFQAA